jgi:plasmid stability protein
MAPQRSRFVPNLSIKNVPEELVEKLRERAARHHRSLQGELMALLSAFVDVSANVPEGPEKSDAAHMRRTGTRRIEEIAAEHRRRWKKAFSQGPRAVDVIRAERDAR